MTSVMGIDPGKRGAIAVINIQTQKVYFWLLSAVQERRDTPFKDIIKQYKVVHAYIEKAQARPKQGVASMFNYGAGYGRIIGNCEAFDLRFELVTPQAWTKEMHKGCSGTDPKQRSKQAALQLFPGQDFRATPRCVTLHDGLIDALLIAEYGRRRFR